MHAIDRHVKTRDSEISTSNRISYSGNHHHLNYEAILAAKITVGNEVVVAVEYRSRGLDSSSCNPELTDFPKSSKGIYGIN